MERLHSKRITAKKIIIAIVVLMLCNFVMPNFIYAVSTEEGGSALEPISKFLCFIPDTITNMLQKMFVSPDRIEIVSPINGDTTYKILYSPGIIFSGTVPALNANFLNPVEDKEVRSREGFSEKTIIELYSGADVDEDHHIVSTTMYTDEHWDARDYYMRIMDCGNGEDLEYNRKKIEQIKQDYGYYAEGTTKEEEQWISDDYKKIEGKLYYTYKPYIPWETADGTRYRLNIIGELDSDELIDLDQGNGTTKRAAVYKTTCRLTIIENGEITEYKSTSRILQPIIANWYKNLRRIALVGLLSVLLYIGIKIVLTSGSAKDKAKYKKMLKDWLMAILLLFVLHYIMAFTTTIIDEINGIIGASTMAQDGEDVLVTSLRNRISEGSSWAAVLTEVVIYDVITVYTIIFTVQYIKRLMYLAFLTMIAPLITLTYPLDKIKDGKAQAFDMWIKDYVFFSLIQVLHLLLYYLFVSSSIQMEQTGNWIYALVAIGFLTVAEKIMKKMFGFEKSQSMGAMAAGATGALVTNAIQTIKDKTKGSSDSKDGGSEEAAKPARTVTTDPLAGLRNATSEVQEEQTALQRMADAYDEGFGTDDWDPQERDALAREAYGGAPAEYTDDEFREILRMSGYENDEEIEAEVAKRHQNMGSGEDTEQNGTNMDVIREANRNIRRIRNINGIKAVFGRYVGPKIVPGIRLVGGAFMGLAGGTIGLAAGISQGDIKSALTGAAAGATAGYNIAGSVVNGVDRTINTVSHTGDAIREVTDTFREGAFGEEYVQQVQNNRFDNAFKRSNNYKLLREEFRKLNSGWSRAKIEDELEKNVDMMLESGITEYRKMLRILQRHSKNPRKYSMENAIKYSTIAEKCPDEILHDKAKFIRFFEDLNIKLPEEQVQELISNIVDFK